MAVNLVVEMSDLIDDAVVVCYHIYQSGTDRKLRYFASFFGVLRCIHYPPSV